MESEEVIVGLPGEATVAFSVAQIDAHEYARISVRLAAHGLMAAATLELVSWSGGAARLPAYFDDLAANWAGWVAEKQWDDDSGTVSMSASHDRVGLVSLTVRVASLPYSAIGAWWAEVVVPVEPGSLMDVARSIRQMVERGTVSS